jgi:acyl-CoA-binding protein
MGREGFINVRKRRPSSDSLVKLCNLFRHSLSLATAPNHTDKPGEIDGSSKITVLTVEQ